MQEKPLHTELRAELYISDKNSIASKGMVLRYSSIDIAMREIQSNIPADKNYSLKLTTESNFNHNSKDVLRHTIYDGDTIDGKEEARVDNMRKYKNWERYQVEENEAYRKSPERLKLLESLEVKDKNHESVSLPQLGARTIYDYIHFVKVTKENKEQMQKSFTNAEEGDILKVSLDQMYIRREEGRDKYKYKGSIELKGEYGAGRVEKEVEFFKIKVEKSILADDHLNMIKHVQGLKIEDFETEAVDKKRQAGLFHGVRYKEGEVYTLRKKKDDNHSNRNLVTLMRTAGLAKEKCAADIRQATINRDGGLEQISNKHNREFQGEIMSNLILNEYLYFDTLEDFAKVTGYTKSATPSLLQISYLDTKEDFEQIKEYIQGKNLIKGESDNEFLVKMRMISRDENAPPSMLEKLVQVNDTEVQKGIAENPNTPTATLWQMKGVDRDETRSEVFDNLAKRGTVWVTEENQEELTEALIDGDISIKGFGELESGNKNCEIVDYEPMIKMGTSIRMMDVEHVGQDGYEVKKNLARNAYIDENEPTDEKVAQKNKTKEKKQEVMKRKAP